MIITNENFEAEVKQSVLPVLLDFYADWCQPCQELAPTVAELAGEYAGRVKVCKVNVDEARELALSFGVRSIPTLVLMKNGEVVATVLGTRPKSALEEFVNQVL